MILEQLRNRLSKTKEFKSFPIDHTQEGSRCIEGIAPSSFPLIISSIFAASKKPVLVVTRNPSSMYELISDLAAFVDESEIAPFPSWEMLPYEFVSPAEAIERDRITTLFKLAAGEHCIAVCTTELLARGA